MYVCVHDFCCAYLNAHTLCVTNSKCLCGCVDVCVLASECHVATLCADTAPKATGRTWCVRAVHQLLMLECQMHTHTNALTQTHIHTACTQLYICSFHSLHMCACIHTPLHWHMLLRVTHGLQCMNAFTSTAKGDTHSGVSNAVPPGTQWSSMIYVTGYCAGCLVHF